MDFKHQLFAVVILGLVGCSNEPNLERLSEPRASSRITNSTDSLSYNDVKTIIKETRQFFKKKYPTPNKLETDSAKEEITRFWVSMISGDLFYQWKGTPWDFNGTTTVPRQGNIACGYFVTSILSDMGVQLNRRKLATCASSEMMRKLVPGRPLINLSSLSYNTFCDSIRKYDAGVFIIGLDYHTGIIVVDTTAAWFIHSYYSGNIGVIKEVIELSPSLKSSKTKWLVPLTADKGFIRRWMYNDVW
jgi:hypothetical protein